ncbi:uncharacterized protein LOC110980822 [Acanthaster planci]|uniref:Uncharacterized protein LOC110980822 n=1 Tax=Acanthaster planci TaxID=133434 RepID=A0A8B7YJU6_ACAPL|nr:uncharacterized protein LOC110980822 [Acanthaster planci]
MLPTRPNLRPNCMLSWMILVVTFCTLAHIFNFFAPVTTPASQTGRPPPRSRQRKESAPTPIQPVTSKVRPSDSQNILVIFTGRWAYLRINFAYIYRSLRKNGGILDQVHYIMVQYNNRTLSKLTRLADSANKHLGQEVFRFRYRNPNKDTRARPKGIFAEITYEIFNEMAKYPKRKYLKLDDDIVYVHPGAFEQLLQQQNTTECFVHFGNIGGANWRSSFIHQEMGIYNNPAINPKKLKFGFDKGGHPKCGWKSAECAELALRAFLFHHGNKSLEKYLFGGRYLTQERARYSINFLLMDVNIIDLKAMMETGPIGNDDEAWLTVKYSRKVKNPNCVVGHAFVVHFSYFTTEAAIKKRDFLKKFETIAYEDLVKFLPQEFQTILAFNTTNKA